MAQGLSSLWSIRNKGIEKWGRAQKQQKVMAGGLGGAPTWQPQLYSPVWHCPDAHISQCPQCPNVYNVWHVMVYNNLVFQKVSIFHSSSCWPICAILACSGLTPWKHHFHWLLRFHYWPCFSSSALSPFLAHCPLLALSTGVPRGYVLSPPLSSFSECSHL